MRGLVRDAALFFAAAVVLGSVANSIPGRHLAWWGKGSEPPKAGVDFQFIDAASADAVRTSLPHVVVLDTRSAAEFAASHVPGARRINFTNLDSQLTPALLAQMRTADAVLIYGDGDETDVEQLLSQELHRRGVGRPYVVMGGFMAWHGGGLPIEGTMS
jgi:rhodanese-related sulfurtransferase